MDLSLRISLAQTTDQPWGFASFRAEDINPPHRAYPRAIPVCPLCRFLHLAVAFYRPTSEECKAGRFAYFALSASGSASLASRIRPNPAVRGSPAGCIDQEDAYRGCPERVDYRYRRRHRSGRVSAAEYCSLGLRRGLARLRLADIQRNA